MKYEKIKKMFILAVIVTLNTRINAKEKDQKKTEQQSEQQKIKNIRKRHIYNKQMPLFYLPLEKKAYWISSRFGMRQHKGKCSMHHGIDLAAPVGTAIKAAQEGIVEHISHDTGYGKCIVINHGNNMKTRYAHLNEILVTENQKIKKLQAIGKVGATGNVRGKNGGAHLHFEIICNEKRLNPELYLTF